MKPALRICVCCCLLVTTLAAGAQTAGKPAAKPKATAEKAAPAPAQDLTPVQQIQIYVDGFHNYQRDVDKPADQQMQMRVTHYCQGLNPDFIQCAVYDGNSKQAHLIGIEHIISDKEYQALPDSEKKYWHPHDGEVDSGMLDLPGVPADKKKEMLAMIRTTHGKTWHVWDPMKDKIPMGDPSLMWAIDPAKMNQQTKDGMEKRKKDYHF